MNPQNLYDYKVLRGSKTEYFQLIGSILPFRLIIHKLWIPENFEPCTGEQVR